MVVGKVPGGGNLVVGGGDGGSIPPEAIQQQDSGVGNSALSGGPPGVRTPGEGQVGFGNSTAPAYSSGLGEPLGSQGLQGQDSYGKK